MIETTKAIVTASKSGKENERKWSKDLMNAGWTVIPSIIVERQQALGLDATDVNIIMHLASYWWKADSKPFPSKATIAKAMGVTPRTVQRRIAAMEKDGLIRREERRVSGKGSKTNIYHLDGLIEGATPFALEKVAERERAKADRAAKAARKGKPKLTVVGNDD